jgi:transaldolase
MKKLKIKVFCDGANLKLINFYNKKKFINGFTTNPSLVAEENIRDYKTFCKKLCKIVKNKHISFEVISEKHKKIVQEAKKLSELSKNVYVKIPILNSHGKSNINSIIECANLGINLNITAVFTIEQVRTIYNNLKNVKSNIIISIFSGRIADTGKDPKPIIKKALQIKKNNKNFKVLWASTREVFNIYEAEACHCDIITVTPDLLNKLKLHGKNLLEYSQETSKSFLRDAINAKIKLI